MLFAQYLPLNKEKNMSHVAVSGGGGWVCLCCAFVVQLLHGMESGATSGKKTILAGAHTHEARFDDFGIS